MKELDLTIANMYQLARDKREMLDAIIKYLVDTYDDDIDWILENHEKFTVLDIDQHFIHLVIKHREDLIKET